jgi:hypothetical protein
MDGVTTCEDDGERLKGRDHSQNLGIDVKIILMDFREVGFVNLHWRRIGTGGGLLRTI